MSADKPPRQPGRLRQSGLLQPLTVAAAYGVLAAVWILLSDSVLGWLVQDPALLVMLSTAKGWLFVAATTVLVFVLLMRRERGSASSGPLPGPQSAATIAANQRQALRTRSVLAVLGMAIAMATGVAVANLWHDQREQAGNQLLAVSDSKAQEISAWHAERMRDASWVQQDTELRTQWLVWQFTHAAGSLQALNEQLTRYLDGVHFRRVALFDGQARLVWRSAGPDLDQDPALLDGVRRALEQGTPQRVGPWRDDAGQLRLAFLAPIAHDSRTPGVAVLHLDPRPYIHPTLANWPLPHTSAEAFLFRREGDQVLFLSQRRYLDTLENAASMPASAARLFTARVLRGDASPNTVLEGVDYRGVESLAVARAIAGTDWWLLAKQDLTELIADAIARALWLLAAGTLALLSMGALVYLLTQRRHLQGMSDQVDALRRTQAELMASEARYRLLAEHGSDVVWLFDLQQQVFLYVSPPVQNLLGLPPEALIGKNFDALTNPTMRDQIAQQLAHRLQALAAGDRSVIDSVDEMAHLHRDGHLLVVEVVSHLLLDAQGRAVQVQGVSRDVTARKAAEAQILLLSQATEQSPAGVIITNLQGEIEYVNHAFERHSGYPRAEVLGRNPRFLQSGQTPASTYQTMWRALKAGERWDGELINRRKDGTVCVQSITIAPVKDERGHIVRYISVQLDVTAQREAEATAHRLAWFDPLTGLPNRQRLLLDLGDSLGSDRRNQLHSAFLLIDIDRFKHVNEALGHGAGDDLLRRVAQRLDPIKHSGDVLAHLSADEFGLLLQSAEPDATAAYGSALRRAQAVLDALALPFVLASGEQVNITASVGVAMLPQNDQDTPGEVLRRADTALNRAKVAGGQQAAFFDAAMGSVVSERFAVEQDLRRGLAAQELRVFLQPQVNRQGHMISAEALVRWAHPDKGLVPPAVFITVAEESDLIADIGDWMLDQVCAHLGQLRAQGRHLPISVNVSPRQFHKPDFVLGVQQALQRHGARASDLTLEITEGVVIEQVDAVVRKMSQLTQLGVRFSIDDFGTGYSSLAYLKRLPIHELKIDRSFVQDAPHDPSDAALVEAILAVASHLRLKVVAEGVETQEQADFLNRRGQVIHQGYLYGRPEPAQALLDRWTAEAPLAN